MEKYLDRYNFKPKDVKISNRYGENYEFNVVKTTNSFAKR